MVNQQVLEGHWTDFKGRIQETWGQVSDNDLQEVKGNVTKLIGLIQRKTGEAREQIESQLEAFAEDAQKLADRGKGAAKQFAQSASEQVHQAYEQASERVSEGYHRAEAMVQQRPIESVAVAFASGLIAGVVVGLVMRSR